MIFRPELARLIIEGRKTATRRVMSDNPNGHWFKGGCIYDVHQVFTINPGRGALRVAEAMVTDVYKQPPLYITGKQAKQEGFKSSADFHKAFLEINGSTTDLREPVWVVEFELVLDFCEDCPKGCVDGYYHDDEASPCPHCRWWEWEVGIG